MSMLSFQASTQYGEWKGTAAADQYGGGTNSFEEVFEATGKVDKDNEVLIGFEFYAGEGYFYLRGYYHPKSQNRDIGGWVPTLNGDFKKEHGPIQVDGYPLDSGWARNGSSGCTSKNALPQHMVVT